MTEEIKNRKNVGQYVYDFSGISDKEISVQQLQQAMQEDYMSNLLACVDNAYPKYKKTFYVVVTTKKEPLLDKVYRNYFYARQSCPTPDYDQTVYRYNDEEGAIEYLWTIPSKDACLIYLENAPFIDSEEYDLLEFVQKFADGTLFRLAKKFNGEEEDSSRLAS